MCVWFSIYQCLISVKYKLQIVDFVIFLDIINVKISHDFVFLIDVQTIAGYLVILSFLFYAYGHYHDLYYIVYEISIT